MIPLEYVLLLNNIRLQGSQMRRKRATISQIEVKEPSHPFDAGILQERNTNLFDMINSALTKGSNRNFIAKKSLALKFKQAQREHCCIDIVNRRSIASSTQNKRPSNIDHLKRQITYLERDELKWDKFPKENQENENPSLASQTTPLKKNEFEIHFVNKLEESVQPIALKGFRNTFKYNFYSTSDQQRPLTTNEKRAFKHIAQQERKKSMKKYSTLQQESDSERSVISRTIHSHLIASTPFRRYPHNSRTKRNHSCKANIDPLEGRQFGKKQSFLIEETTLD